MDECKHDGKWRLGLDMNVVCGQCGAKIRGVLESQDRQLDAAARDINELIQECPRATYECKISDCDECEGKDDYSACWRKKWEGKANG